MVAAPRQSEISLRRAAILLSNLDAESRRRLLSHLPNAQAASLRAAAASLVDVDPLEVRRVVDAFVGRVTIEQSRKSEQQAGSPMRESVGSETNIQDGEGVNESGAGKTLQFLNQVSDQTLLQVVRAEHPQTVAIVLGALDPEQAAKLLRELPAEVRGAAIRRLGRLDEVPADVLSEIAEHLRKVVGEIEPVSGGGGRKSLTSILALLDAEERQTLVGDAASSDKLVAAAMRDVAGTRSVVKGTEEAGAERVSRAALIAAEESSENVDDEVQTIPMRRSQMAVQQSDWNGNRETSRTVDQEAERNADMRTPHDEIYSREIMRQVDEMLEALKPRELKGLLAKMETRQAILTLCGLSPGQVKRLMKCLPRRQVRDVEQRMSGIGALELREIDEAKLAAVEILTGKSLGDLGSDVVEFGVMSKRAA